MPDGYLMMWYDKVYDLVEKVIRARDYYCAKYGQVPNMVMVHPSATEPECKQIVGMKLLINPYVLPHHLYIGHMEEIE